MARIPRVIIPGLPHHITQRGNSRKIVFHEDSEYRVYLRALLRFSRRQELRIWAYCLLPNHVHLIAVPRRPDSLARTLAHTHMDYARQYNVRHDGCGHLWQARFYSCPLDDSHLWRAMAYVERNPVRAGLVGIAGQYPWSSAATHLSGHDPLGLIEMDSWRSRYTPERWGEALATSLGEEALGERIRTASSTGRPIGSAEFVEQLEHITGRSLRRRRVGRKKKPAEAQPLLDMGV